MMIRVLIHVTEDPLIALTDEVLQAYAVNTVEPLYRGHHWDPAGCPIQRGVPNSEVD